MKKYVEKVLFFGLHLLFILPFFVLEGCLLSAEAKDAYIIPLREYAEATDKKGKIRVAKIIKGKGPRSPQPGMSSRENFNRFRKLVGISPRYYFNPALWLPARWKDLGNDVESEPVLVTYTNPSGQKQTRMVTTDDEGHVEIDPDWLGKPGIEISFPKASHYRSKKKKTEVFSFEDHPGDTLYFTDHDDTVKFTGIVKVRSEELGPDGDRKRSKSKENLARFPFTNPHDWYPFPGAAELARGITNNGGKKVPMTVITGSPVFLSDDIRKFYQLKGFPTPDSLHLRNLKDGTELDPDPTDAFDYKFEAFTKAIDGALKKGKLKTVIFDGDRGEKDPEVALALAKKYPSVKFIIGINNITSGGKDSKRFKDFENRSNVEFVVYDNKYEFAKVLYKHGKISKKTLEEVKKAIVKSNKNVIDEVKKGKILRKKPLFNFFPSRRLTLEELERYHLYYPKFDGVTYKVSAPKKEGFLDKVKDLFD